MTEKIEWYQEVLELEPSSKVFFPLAKLLTANNRQPEAISTLKHGLDRHPEFLEARLMLVDLLARVGEKESSLYEAERISSKLATYPGFLEAWASISENEGRNDAAVALKLLSTFLEGKDVSLLDVISSGLNSVCSSGRAGIAGIKGEKGEKGENDKQSKIFSVSEPAFIEKGVEANLLVEEAGSNLDPNLGAGIFDEEPLPESLEESDALSKLLAGDEFEEAAEEIVGGAAEETEESAESVDVAESAEPSESADVAEPLEVSAESMGELLNEVPAVASEASANISEDDAYEHETDEEPFSLRTKTMATVLVEQGDYNGALEIYEELLASSEDPEKRKDLEARVEELKHKVGAAEQKAAQQAAAAEVKEEPLHSNQKTFEFLKTLAKRLEMRAE